MAKILTLEEFKKHNKRLGWDCYDAYKDYYNQKVDHIWIPFYQWREDILSTTELDQEVHKQKRLLSNTDEKLRSEVLMLAFRSSFYRDGYDFGDDCVMFYFQMDDEKRYKAVKKFLTNFGPFLSQEHIEEIQTRIISHFPESEENRLNKVIDSISQKQPVRVSKNDKQVEEAKRRAVDERQHT